MNVSDVLDAYLREHAEVKAVAADRQEYGSRHLKRHLGETLIQDIGIPECREYRAKRLKEKAADSTIRRELGILRAAGGHAHKWKRLTLDQLPQIELPEPGEPEKVTWFTKAQIAGMFRARSFGHFACFLRIAYYTAARRDSIERLLKAQVDRDAGCIHLARPKERKTKKRRPTVPLFAEIRPAVDWLWDKSGTPYLFGRQRDFYKPFQLLMEDMELKGHPHMLRHSRATHMLQDGENPYKVAGLLGDNLATVLKVYGHVSVGFLHTESAVEGNALEAVSGGFNSGQFRTAAE